MNRKLPPEKNPNYVHPGSKRLKLTLFWTKSAGMRVASKYLAKAEEMLKEHGLSLDVYPKTKTTAHTLSPKDLYEDHPEDQSEKDAGVLRNLAHQAYPKGNGRLPVIFVPFHSTTGEPAKGKTWGRPRTGAVDGVDWLTFLVINSEKLSPDHVTLLHEMGHGANLDHNTGDVVNFMAYGVKRTVMYENQVKKLAKSYFCA